MKQQKLDAQLAQWERQGLITPQQKLGILSYEDSRRTVPWVLYSFIMLGVTVIAVGVVSLIAANWSEIPAWLKLAVDFALLSGLAACLCRYGDGSKPLIFDALAALFIFFCLASIGLIAQIYHTGGQLYQAMLLWCAITLPVTLFAFRKVIPHLWTAAFIAAVTAYCFHEARMGGSSGMYRLALFWSLPLWVFLAALVSRKLRPLAVLAGPFFLWSGLTLINATLYFDFAHSSGMILEYGLHPARLLHDGGSASVLYRTIDLMALAVIWAMVMMKSLDKKTRIVLGLLAALFCVMMNIYDFIQYEQLRSISGSYGQYPLMLKLLGPAMAIAVLLLLSFLFAGLGRQRLFNVCVNLIGLRFLIIYFQVFGSLATTGIGLIISGLIIIGAVAGWYKCRKHVQAWLGGLLK